MHGEPDTETTSQLHKRICERAYQLWEERGCPEGSPDHDWFMAQREIEGPPQEPPSPEFIYTAAV
jgi:hypothetical protein